MQRSRSSSEEEEEEVDPRVKGELDALNQSTDDINKYENEISEERMKFKVLLADATQQLAILGKKYGKSIEKARPYYDTMKEVKQAQAALQRAAHNFQKSNGIHRAAKETISLAEQRLSEVGDQKVDAAWQEMLNIQTMRFMQAEIDRTRSEKIHQRAAQKYEYLDKKAKKQKSKHKMSTKTAQSYFESKERLEFKLQKQRVRVDEVQRKINDAKARYKTALSNLEKISLEIHEQRQNAHLKALLSVRVDGEGSATPDEDNLVAMAKQSQFDLNEPKSYDDVNELEAELDDFTFDDDVSADEYDFSSSEEGSVSSESSGRRSAPMSPISGRHASNRLSYRRQTSSNSLEDQPGALGRSPRMRRSRKKQNLIKQESVIEEDDVFNNNLNVTPPHHMKEAKCDVSNSDESRDQTYDTLHGVNTTVKSQAVSNDKNGVESEEYDIFEDLC